MACIKKRDKQMHGQTHNPKAICPSKLEEVGGFKRLCLCASITVDVKTVEGQNDTGPKCHRAEMRDGSKQC